jgi:hypothetical protein
VSFVLEVVEFQFLTESLRVRSVRPVCNECRYNEEVHGGGWGWGGLAVGGWGGALEKEEGEMG